MLKSNQYEDRLRFLEYSPDSPSIMETFKASQERIPKPNGSALVVINFLGMITSWTPVQFLRRNMLISQLCRLSRDGRIRRPGFPRLLLRTFLSGTTKRISGPRNPCLWKLSVARTLQWVRKSILWGTTQGFETLSIPSPVVGVHPTCYGAQRKNSICSTSVDDMLPYDYRRSW